MSNVRMIAFFLFGITVMALALVLPGLLDGGAAVAAERTHLSLLADGGADALAFPGVSLAKDAGGKWVFAEPNLGETDARVVARLLDALAAARIDDFRTIDDLAQSGRRLEDFGFSAASPWVALSRGGAGGETERIVFGKDVPGGKSAYARIDGIKSVFTVPAAVKGQMPENADSLRRRAAAEIPPEAVETIEFRATGRPFVKIVRRGRDWRFTSPAEGPADREAVEALLARLYSMRAESFADGIDDSAAGFAGEKAFSVKIADATGQSDSVAFGAGAGEGFVWMKFGARGNAASVPADDAEFCRKCTEGFRNVRVFALEADDIRRISVTTGAAGGGLFVLQRGDGGLWRIESPVAADADQSAAEAFAKKVAALRRSDLAEAGDKDAVGLSATDGEAKGQVVSVAGDEFGEKAFNAIRSKVLLSVQAQDVRRIVVRTGTGERVTIERDAMRNAWNLVRTPGDGTQGRQLMPDAVKNLLSAIERVAAERIVAVSATEEDREKCGLGKGAYSISVDFLDRKKPRRTTISIGGKTDDGGRYAAEGLDGALAVLPPVTASALTAPLTQQR